MRILGIILIFFVTEVVFAKTTIGNPSSRRTKENLVNLAKEKQQEADKAREAVRYVDREPYVPQLYDYGAELGATSGELSYYTLGAAIGFHTGTCIFSNSQSCQQYADIIFDATGRDSHTHYLGLGSLRWQWVNFPSSWSMLTRVLIGANNQIVPTGVKQYFVYGGGIGITTYLHPKADLRFEYRAYHADQLYHQVTFSVLLKMERWIEFFAEKLKDIGVGTAEVTGTVIKSTADVVGDTATGAAELTGIKDKSDEKKSDDKKK